MNEDIQRISKELVKWEKIRRVETRATRRPHFSQLSISQELSVIIENNSRKAVATEKNLVELVVAMDILYGPSDVEEGRSKWIEKGVVVTVDVTSTATDPVCLSICRWGRRALPSTDRSIR